MSRLPVWPTRFGQSILAGLLLLAVVIFLPATKAHAMNIQEVKSPGGVSAWLVEEHSVPLIALRFGFDGGNAQDPQGMEGLANFLASMMDEGSGELTAKQFQERMEEIAMHMSFDDARDGFYGSFETLTENRDKAIDLLSLAVNKPRFDPDAIERTRGQLQASLIQAARDPDRVASEQWAALAFAGHPYGRPANGTAGSVKKITRADLLAAHSRLLAKDTLKVVAVGDIDAKMLGGILDRVFGKLPGKAKLSTVQQIVPNATERLKVIDMAVPQSVARFGLPAMPRKDPDFMGAFVLNQIVGGGSMTSRLGLEIREKRGLAYSVYTSLQPFKYTSFLAGGVATKNEEIGQSLELIRSELNRIATEGPTEEELVNAKSYLIGSFALRFDTNAKIAGQLLFIQQEELGKDYVDRRNGEIQAVTMEKVKHVAKRMFEGQELITTIVGKPKGLTPRG
jgi:zinc protease